MAKITLEIHFTTLSPIFCKPTTRIMSKKFEDSEVEAGYMGDDSYLLSAQKAADNFLRKWAKDGFIYHEHHRNPQEIIPFHCITAIFQTSDE